MRSLCSFARGFDWDTCKQNTMGAENENNNVSTKLLDSEQKKEHSPSGQTPTVLSDTCKVILILIFYTLLYMFLITIKRTC